MILILRIIHQIHPKQKNGSNIPLLPIELIVVQFFKIMQKSSSHLQFI